MYSLFSFLAVLLFALILIRLEQLFPYNKNRSFFRKGFFNDFFWYGIVQSLVLGLVISEIIRMLQNVSWLSEARVFENVGWGWQLLFFLVLHDLYIFCFHFLQHRVPLLWKIHELHHSNNEIDWIAGARSHVLEILINQTIEFAPMVILGAAPEIVIIKGAIDGCWGMYIHSNINVQSGVLQYIINGPEMHRWHHSNNVPAAHNKNFGTKFAFWDWIFGTAYFPKGEKACTFGIEGVVFPNNYFVQQIHSFRKNGQHKG